MNNNRKLMSIFGIAKRNISNRKIRSGIMIAFVFILASSLYISSLLINSMNLGLEKTIGRIGADLIVVPQEYENNMRSSLFLGECSTFYTDRSYMDKVAETEGIQQMTPQLYIASLEAECCGLPTQIIAFDPETDFIVTPWLQDINKKEINYGEVIVGNGVVADVGSTIKFFDIDFPVVGKLENTQTGYDYCVFMRFDTSKIILESERFKSLVDSTIDPDNVISAIMIKAKNGANLNTMASRITYTYKIPVKAFTTNGMFSAISDNLDNLTSFSSILVTISFILAVLALICIFTITINERQHEFGVLISLGATQKQLVLIIVLEAVMIGLIGGVLAVIISAVASFIFNNAITSALEIPYLDNSPSDLIPLILKTLLIAIGSSILASLYSAIRIGRAEPMTLIKGDE